MVVGNQNAIVSFVSTTKIYLVDIRMGIYLDTRSLGPVVRLSYINMHRCALISCACAAQGIVHQSGDDVGSLSR
jgi:hypothetical protein